jgi:hypothetical protein
MYRIYLIHVEFGIACPFGIRRCRINSVSLLQFTFRTSQKNVGLDMCWDQEGNVIKLIIL